MARNFFTQTTDSVVALTAATAKTVLQLLAASGVRVALQAVTITFDGTSGSATPVVVQLVRQTGAGTASARNPVKKDSDVSTSLQVTGQKSFSAEPTSDDAILATWHVHPQAGMSLSLPMPGEFIIPGAGRVGLKINAPAAVNCLATIEGEE